MHRDDIGLMKYSVTSCIQLLSFVCIELTFPQGAFRRPFDLFFSVSIFPCLRIPLNIFQLMKLHNGFKPKVIIPVLFLLLHVPPLPVHKGDG